MGDAVTNVIVAIVGDRCKRGYQPPSLLGVDCAASTVTRTDPHSLHKQDFFSHGEPPGVSTVRRRCEALRSTAGGREEGCHHHGGGPFVMKSSRKWQKAEVRWSSFVGGSLVEWRVSLNLTKLVNCAAMGSNSQQGPACNASRERSRSGRVTGRHSPQGGSPRQPKVVCQDNRAWWHRERTTHE